MDFKSALRELKKANENRIAFDQQWSEEDAKRILVVPFIEALGYDTRNPEEFLSEVTAPGVGRVDYAIHRDGKPVIIIECKSVDTSPLQYGRAQKQLEQYFDATRPYVGILTDGIRYQFFSDLDTDNRMDRDPFLGFDLRDLEDEEDESSGTLAVDALGFFTKAEFNPTITRDAAVSMKYERDIRQFLDKQLAGGELDSDFVDLLARRVHRGRLTQKVQAQVGNAAQKVIGEFRTDLAKEIATNPKQGTTREELDGYFIVKNILWNVVGSDRVVMKDKKSYCTIQLDDSDRSHQRVCVLHFNNLERKRIELLDGSAKEQLPITSVGEINNYADRIRATARGILENEK